VWRDQLDMTGEGLAADGNGDDMVTQIDYEIWAANFGLTADGAASQTQFAYVPEPSTALLLGAGAFIASGFWCISSRNHGSSRSRGISP
jgi:hypothetical protein